MANVNNVTQIKANFASICNEEWFMNIGDQVAEKFKKPLSDTGAAEAIADSIVLLGKGVRDACKGNHPVAKLSAFTLMTTMTDDQALAIAAGIVLADRMGI